MTRVTPALLLLLALPLAARAQDKPPSDRAAVPPKTSEQKRAACEAEGPKNGIPAEQEAFWKEQCGLGKEPVEILAMLRAAPASGERSKKQAQETADHAKEREESAKKFEGLSGKVLETLGSGEIGALYGERGGGAVTAMPAGAPGARATLPAGPAAAPAGAYSALYAGLDARSAAFWTQAATEFAGNPKGKELLDKFAAAGAPLPKLVIEKIDTSSYDMAYQYGRNEMVVGTRYLKEYGLKPADLDDPKKREEFIAATSPLLYHESDHAWTDVQFPRKTPGTAASFGREINAYADEMAFIHHKARQDPAWAQSKHAQGFMAQYDAYLEDPSAFMDKVSKSPGYKDMPSMDTLQKKMQEELDMEKKRPKPRYPGLEDDMKSLKAEIDYEEKKVVAAVNGELNVMRAERAIDETDSLPGPQALGKLTAARKRLGAFPAPDQEKWRKKIDAAAEKETANEVATIQDSLHNGNPAYADQSLRALEDWAKAAGGKVPAAVEMSREEIYRAGIKKNLEYAEANAEKYKKSAGEMKARHKQSLIYTLNEAREDASRLGVNIDVRLAAVLRKAGL